MKKNKYLNVIILIIIMFLLFDVVHAETVKYTSCGTTKGIPYYLPPLIRTFVVIIQFIVPIIIIIMGSTDLLKVVFGNNKDDLAKAMKKLVLRFIAGAAVFFLVTLVKELIKTANDENSGNNLSACFSCFAVNERYCTSYDVEVNNDDKESTNNDKVQQFLEKREQQRKENEEKAKQAKKRNTTGDKSSTSNITPGTQNIFIGDSRMVGLCDAVTGASFSIDTGIYHYGNNYFIAEGGKNFYWLKNDAVPLVNQVLEENPNVRFNIVIDMGTNDSYYDGSSNNRNLFFNVSDNYLPLYQKLSNEWSGHKIIISSVNPIKGDVPSHYQAYMYSNDSVNQFNAIIRSGISNLPNVTYCDVNSQIANTYKTSDGIHYYAETYREIFQLMNNCIKN